MQAEYELIKFDIILNGKVIGDVEKRVDEILGDRWIVYLKVDDGSSFPYPLCGIGDDPDEAIQNVFARNRERMTHMLRDLERLETILSVPTLVELACI